jgi:small-conductance mechanosensitive channel
VAANAPSRPLYILARDLLLALVVGAALYLVFEVFNKLFLTSFNAPAILLLEAGAILLVAYLVARAVSGATSALMARQGGASRAHVVRLFLNILVAIGAVLALFKLAGVSLESIFLGSALAGIVLGLAAQTVLANVFAGLLLAVADPFRPGDRVTFVSSSYGAIAPSYAHEMMYPGYSGTIEDVGLIYTVLRIDSGGRAKIPNSVVLSALVLRPIPGSARSQRVRMSFPQAVSVGTVEDALKELSARFASSYPGSSPPRLEVADISATSWDAVIVVWTTEADENAVRDTILRGVLARAVRPTPPA